MKRAEYRAARRLVRDNGRAALRWINPSAAAVMAHVMALEKVVDPLAQLANDREVLNLSLRNWLQWRRAAWLEDWDLVPVRWGIDNVRTAGMELRRERPACTMPTNHSSTWR